jgi:hypothetical protein
MSNSKTVTRKTYDRYVKSGKWIEVTAPYHPVVWGEVSGATYAVVVTAKATRGVHNVAGRRLNIDIRG